MGTTLVLGTWRVFSSSEYLQAPLKGPPFPLDCNCGVMVPGEGATQGFGEPRVHQAAYALLVVPEELQLEGRIKQKIVSHLLLAWHCMSSVLSSWGFSMDTAFCCSRCWPSWLLREVAASAQSLQVHINTLRCVYGQAARIRGDMGTGSNVIIPRRKMVCNSKRKRLSPYLKATNFALLLYTFLNVCVCKCEIPTIFFYWKFDLLKYNFPSEIINEGYAHNSLL